MNAENWLVDEEAVDPEAQQLYASPITACGLPIGELRMIGHVRGAAVFSR